MAARYDYLLTSVCEIKKQHREG